MRSPLPIATCRSAFALASTLLVAGIVTGCGARTAVDGAWTEGLARSVPFNHVLVVGISPNSRMRRSFEIALAEQLAARGGKATAAVQTAESRLQLTQEIIASMVTSTGADAVVVTRLANRKITAQETGSRVGVKTERPPTLNGGAGLVELFSLEYKEYEEPGELRATSTVVVETTVYEARDSGHLLYTLTTTSKFREERDDVIADVARAIAAQLRSEHLVR